MGVRLHRFRESTADESNENVCKYMLRCCSNALYFPRPRTSFLTLASFLLLFLFLEEKYRGSETELNEYLRKENDLLYFNSDPKSIGKAELSLLNSKFYHPGGPCIATLVTEEDKDVEELQTALKSLAFLNGDKNPAHPAPVLVFNEGNLNSEQVKAIVQSTTRPIAFPLVDFVSFPQGFDPDNESPEFIVKGRKTWGYYQMIRFWVTGIWKHPAITNFETVMRIDSDSCFKEPNAYLPNFANENLSYHSQYVGVEDGVKFLTGLFDFAKNFMAEVKDPPEPRNYLLWDMAKKSWESEQPTLPVFRTNFEVSRKSFMQRQDVTRWHVALTEKEPFGILRHRWGDAVTRFLTASMFVNMDEIMTIRPTGYFHKIGCTKEEVEEALEKHNLI